VAESTLTLGWADLKKEVGFFLGFGSTIANWSASQVTTIEGIVQSGYRQVLYLPAMQGVQPGYEWSFLRPTTTLALVADTGDYDLPDDFGRMVGEFHYAPDEHQAPIREIALPALLDMRSASDCNAYPNFFATRFKDTDGDAGQRQEVLFYPESDAAYRLYYCYDSYQGALSDTYPYPLGGMQMSELYRESCLAVAEGRNDGEPGVHQQIFERLAIDRVARDRRRGAKNFGRMGQPGMRGTSDWRRGSKLYEGAYEVTYKGEYL